MARRFEVDSLIGEYRVTGFLGEGGMGEVYLGVHEKLGRPAAIKVLSSAAKDESFRTRFFNEARLQANLHHPNIATLYDFQQQGDELLIFMEYVDGESLDERLGRSSMAVEDALRAFKHVCEAVGYIHANGIVHRDIKSQNIKIASNGAVKLLDFGIAKQEASHGLTQTGGVIGTPTYLSPEQLRGGKASPQTDIWALGVLLYEMLTGRLPFEGESIGGLVLKITTESFTPADTVNPAVPREVSRIITRCLQKDSASRFRSVDELVTSVDAAMGGPAGGDTVAGNFKRALGMSRQAQLPHVPAVTRDSEAVASNSGFPVGILAAAGGGLLVLLFVIVGAAFWILGGEAPIANVAAKNNTATKTSAPANSQHVRVDVDEGKAQVIRDGQVVGTTPLDIDIASGEKPNLTLRRDGYEDKTVQIEPTAGKKTLTFSLKPKN
ncbi:MAG: serine/threonine protein kinase [Acidobacteria bacterium]|nr:serine/threonine protein kinase [Acidobacteriota bacterium]